MQETIGELFGSEVANRVGPVWGIGRDGELGAVYGPTGQEGFYVLGGGFMGCRSYSHYTARYIKGALEGLIPTPHSPGNTQPTLQESAQTGPVRKPEFAVGR